MWNVASVQSISMNKDTVPVYDRPESLVSCRLLAASPTVSSAQGEDGGADAPPA